ncbi:MAG: hypothetical protein ACI89E_001224, partial [Planctomycetota bacterium]
AVCGIIDRMELGDRSYGSHVDQDEQS